MKFPVFGFFLSFQVRGDSFTRRLRYRSRWVLYHPMSHSNERPTLAVMAAGMGSRYGGLKQLDPVGPAGEVMLEYAIYDALRAGFGRVVFIIRREFEKEFLEGVLSRFPKGCHADLVFQSLEDIPEGFGVPHDRTKPWGTTHAVLSLRHAVAEPFCVINADDFYGRGSLGTAAKYFSESGGAGGRPIRLAMVGYRLRNTLSEHGGVARGHCRTDDRGRLISLEEWNPIVRDGDSIEYRPEGAAVVKLTGDELVSMNFWAFRPDVFQPLEALFSEFLKERGSVPGSECLLPNTVGQMIRQGEAEVLVLESDSPWFGVTYREDKPKVQAAIQRLVSEGEYPSPLWG